jgi:hypothetical protein
MPQEPDDSSADMRKGMGERWGAGRDRRRKRLDAYASVPLARSTCPALRDHAQEQKRQEPATGTRRTRTASTPLVHGLLGSLLEILPVAVLVDVVVGNLGRIGVDGRVRVVAVLSTVGFAVEAVAVVVAGAVAVAVHTVVPVVGGARVDRVVRVVAVLVSAAHLPVRIAADGHYIWMEPWAPGDLDEDGLDDFALSFPYYGDGFTPDGGCLYLWSGAPPDGGWKPPPADLTIYGDDANANFGHDLAEKVHFDGDGHLDLVLSAPHDVPRTTEGTILIWYGPLTLSGLALSSAADGVIEESVGWEAFGYGLIPAGDVNADGADDLWAGTEELPVLILGGIR